MLEHHAHVLTNLVQIGFLVGHVVTVHNDFPGGDFFQPVQAPKEGGLAGAGGSQNHHDLTFADVGGYVLEDFQLAEILLQMGNVNFHIVLIHGHGSVSFPDALPDGTAA